MDKSGFGEWLQKELEKRSWSQSEMSRRSGISQAQIGRLIAGTRNPGYDACEAIAHTLGYSVDTIYRIAGLLPKSRSNTPDMDAVIEAMQDLPEAWQARIAEDARRTRQFYEQQEQLRIERERQLLVGKRDTGKLPNLP